VVPANTVARLHWLGKVRIAADTNASRLMGLWGKPESAQLENQTLEKLSTALWRSGSVATRHSGPIGGSSFLRPLLDDLVNQESYLEVCETTNDLGEAAFAIRLNDIRASLWETNLVSLLASLGGGQPATAPGRIGGWMIHITNQPSPTVAAKLPHTGQSFQLARSGEWTVVGFGTGNQTLFEEFLTRITRNQHPFREPATNGWLEADLDLKRAARALNFTWTAPAECPRVLLTISGDGENVKTRGELDFAHALGFGLSPWLVPTNLIQGPLISFTAARGLLKPLAQSLAPSFKLRLESLPDQVFLWNRSGPPLQAFFAFPVRDAANEIAKASSNLVDWSRANVEPRRFGAIEFDPDHGGLAWNGLAFAAPFLRAETNFGTQYVYGGFGLHTSRTNYIPPELLAHVLEATNMVYFDWELTWDKVINWRYLDDASRIVLDAAHVPRLTPDAAVLQWLPVASNSLSHAVTEIKLTQTNQLVFFRKSTIGLTSLEIALLGDWLDLPQFPYGFDTLLKTNPAPPFRVPAPRTNAPAAIKPSEHP
jgi:hypothetical protein